MKNRLSRMVDPHTRTSVMLACDHGYFMGPTQKLEEPRKTIEPLVQFADALSVTRGVLRKCVDPDWRYSILLRVSGRTSILKEDLSDVEITVSMDDALRLNVSGVALSIFVGSAHEKQTLVNLAKLVNSGRRNGHAGYGDHGCRKELEKRDCALP